MAEEHKEGLNAELVGKDLENCCLTESVCEQCQGEGCIIGYAKRCIADYKSAPKKEVENGMERIPATDFKVFEEMELEKGIVHILKECKNCKEDHIESCIINVVRGCYEVGLFGDTQPYEGTTLQYLMYIKETFPDKSAQIADLYIK